MKDFALVKSTETVLTALGGADFEDENISHLALQILLDYTAGLIPYRKTLYRMRKCARRAVAWDVQRSGETS